MIEAHGGGHGFICDVCGGATAEGIAAAMGCKRTKYFDLMNKDTDFANAIEEAKSVADNLVQKSGFKAACGYTYQETHEEMLPVYKDKEGNIQYEKMVSKVITKHVAPQPSIWRLWMMNRQPGVWRDKADLNLGGEVFLLNAPTIEKPEGAYE